MPAVILCVLGIFACATVALWTPCHLGRRVADAHMRLQRLYLPQTRVVIEPDMFGHIIKVTDDLSMIRHASGRVAYMPMPRPTRAPRPLPRALKAVLLTFFTL